MTDLPDNRTLPDEDLAVAIEARDWSASGLGPPDQWPALLQTMVSLVVGSRFSMWMGWGPDLCFFYNAAYARDTLGVKHPGALGRPFREVWPEILDEIAPRLQAVLTEGAATWDEALMLFLERSGYKEETYHTFSYSPIREADGRVVGLLCVVSEETQRVLAERRMATLRDLASGMSAARTEAAVLEAASETLDRNQRDLPYTLIYLFVEDGTARLAAATGVRPGHRVAPPVIRLGDRNAPWPLDDVVSAGASLVRAAPTVPDLPAGAWPDPSVEAVLVPLAEGATAAPTGVFVAGINPFRALDPDYRAFTDLVAASIASGVAAVRAYEAERRRAESLSELDRAKTEFFSNVSHEFRTPLTLILAPADDALRDDLAPLEGPQRARMEIIQRNARRLRRLVNDMLDFARIEGGRLQAETVPTDLVEYTRGVALSFGAVIERAGLRFELDLEPIDGPVHVDRDMWEKILLNLLSNALEFTLDGTIRLALAGAGDQVVLSVADTGVGIPAEHQAHLFERFYRARRAAARSHEGTGIGLALVDELVRLHGGDVSVESAEGSGSTFRVRLPYGSFSGATAGAPRESALPAYLDEALQWVAGAEGTPGDRPSVRTTGGGTAPATVLVVDDNPDMRSYLVRILAPYWTVQVAGDGLEALELTARTRPDLVLTDVMMPRLDGFALLGALRADPATATIPVVFLSARAGDEAAVEGLEAGADDYLVKPFSGLELLARVRSNLELAGLRNRDAAWRSALVDSLHDAVVVLDSRGTVIEANAAFERILGFPRAGIPYAPPFPWTYDAATDAQAARAATEAFSQLVGGGRLTAVVPLRHRLGHRVDAAVTANSVGEGEGRRFVVAFHDVTAELAAAERDAALARLGIGLAEAGDVRQVHEAGLTELVRVFGGRRAAILQAGEDGVGVVARSDAAPEGPLLSGGGAAEILARAAGQVTAVLNSPEDERVAVGLAALLDPGRPERAVWLELDPPRTVSADERALFSVLCAYFGQAVHRAQLFDDSRTVATALQRSILGPTAVPASVAVRYLPAVAPLEVGGDWYDVVELDDERLGLVVGDCTGRGLSAAATMGQLRSACRALLLQTESPAGVLDALDTFAERLPAAMGTTVFCGVIDTRDGILRYSSAGHLPGLLLNPGAGVEPLDGGQGVPLGFAAGHGRPEGGIRMVPGSTLVLYTDGLIERRGESLEVGIGRLRDAVAGLDRPAPEGAADEVLARLVPHGDHEDDIALLLYRQPGGPAPGAPFVTRVRADAAELSGFRRRLAEWLAANGVADMAANEVLIACGEACANAIEHAYGFRNDRVVEVAGILTKGAISLTIRDRGTWKQPGRTDERGRGIAIMRALSDQVRVEPGPDGTVVTMVKRVGP